MTDKLHVDYDALAKAVEAHKEQAARIRQCTQPDYEFLERFPDVFGLICDPVRKAIIKYSEVRQQRGELIARDHEHCAGALCGFDTNLRHADEEGGGAVAKVFDGTQAFPPLSLLNVNGSPHGENPAIS